MFKQIKQLSNLKLSLLISALYVGVGTLYILLTDNSQIIDLKDGILYQIFWPATSMASFMVFVGGGVVSCLIGELLVVAFVFLIIHGFIISFRSDPTPR